MNQQITKICTNPNCIHFGNPQLLINFSKRSILKSGLRSQCKDCDKITEKNRKRCSVVVNFKICSNTNCMNANKKQPITNFYKDSSKLDGYCCKCKTCDKEYHKNLRNYNYNYRKKYRNLPAKFNTYFDKLNKYDECRQDPYNPELLQVRCTYCDRWFNPICSHVISRINAINGKHSGEGRLYCSEGCKTACPTYNQVLYPKDFKPATSREAQPELRKLVLLRDNYTCQKCNKSKEDNPEMELHCHHIDPVINNPIESADIDNCITVCKSCHKEIHKTISGCSFNELKCN